MIILYKNKVQRVESDQILYQFRYKEYMDAILEFETKISYYQNKLKNLILQGV